MHHLFLKNNHDDWLSIQLLHLLQLPSAVLFLKDKSERALQHHFLLRVALLLWLWICIPLGILVETHLEDLVKSLLTQFVCRALKDDGLKRSGPLGQPLTPPIQPPVVALDLWDDHSCLYLLIYSALTQLRVWSLLGPLTLICCWSCLLLFSQESVRDHMEIIGSVTGFWESLHLASCFRVAAVKKMIHKKCSPHFKSTQSQRVWVWDFFVYLVCLQLGQCHSKPRVCHRRRQVSQHDPGA